MKNKFFLYSAILYAFLFLGLIVGQEKPIETKTQQLQKVQEVKFELIPIIEIPQKIDQVKTFLKKINSIEIPATELDNVEEDFKNLLENISHLEKESTKKIIKSTTSKKLEDYKAKWEKYLVDLGSFKSTLIKSSERLNKEREQIDRILEYWELTYANAKEEKAPKSLLNRLLELKRDVKKTENSLFKIFTKVLSITDKVSVKEVAIKETLANISKQIDENRSLIFTFDSKPLWTAFSDTTTDTIAFSKNFDMSTERISAAINEFWDMYSETFPYYVIFFFIVLSIILYLRNFGNKYVDKEIRENEKYALKILNRPIFVALLVTIYFHLVFFPLSPIVIREIAKFLMVVPLLVLFPTFISRNFRKPLIFIAVVYMLHQLIEFSVGTGLYLRIYIIALTILMIIGLFWFNFMDTSELVPERLKIVRVLNIISKVLIAVLFLSLLGNIIGNTAFSILVFNGVMRTIYTSLIIITAIQVFYTLLTIALETKLAKISLIIKKHSTQVKQFILPLVKFIAIIFWFTRLLNNFEIYDDFENYFVLFFNSPIDLGTIQISVSEIFFFFFSIWLAIQINKFIKFFLESEVFERVKLPRGVPAAIVLMVKYTVVTLGFLFALSLVGFSMEKFAIIAGALGVGIGFGLQSIVNNFISGLILLFERPIQVGDTISLPNLMGSVKRIGIRASIIQTFEGAEVIVPNADLMTGQVTNWTLSDKKRRIEIVIGVHFSANPDEVMNILNNSLDERNDILKYPAPYVLFQGHKESTQNFVLRFWTENSGDWIFIRSEVLLSITKMLAAAGIEIPYQQQNVYLKELEKDRQSK